MIPHRGITKVGFDYDGFFRYVYDSPFRLFELSGLEPTPQQRAYFQTMEDEHRLPLDKRLKRYAMCSGFGVGKTRSLAVTQMWRAPRMKEGRGVHTSPTGHQNRDAFLGEGRLLVSQGDPILAHIYHFYHDRIRILDNKNWEILTMTTVNPVNMQGIHRENLTITVDEAAGVSPLIVRNFKGTLTNDDGMLVLAGNPNTRQSPLHDAMEGTERRLWHRFRFSSLDSPIVNRANIDRIAAEFGVQSDVYRVQVLGLFPEGDPSAVIHPERLREAMQRYESHSYYRHLPLPGYKYPVQFGLDFAWEGDNESVIAVRENRRVKFEVHLKVSSEDLVSRAKQIQDEMGVSNDQCIYVGDSSGEAGTAMRRLLQEDNRNMMAFANGSPRVHEKRIYKNKITEAWFALKRLLTEGAVVIQEDNILRDQLTSRKYEIEDTSGLVFIEKKNKHISQGWASPDRAEAVIYACYPQELSTVQGVILTYPTGERRPDPVPLRR